MFWVDVERGRLNLKHNTILDCEVKPVFDLEAFSIVEFDRYKLLMLI